MWEDIHVGFEDETVNFGPREEVWTGPQVFEIHTWITVSTLNKEKTSPNIFCATSPQYIGLAVDTQLSLFVQESHELLITFDFDSPVDTLAFSEDSKLLLVGETVGTLHIFDVAQQRRLLAVPLVLCKDERQEKSFLSINITPADSEGCITIMVLTKLQLIMFYNINFAQLKEAIKSQDQTIMQKAQAAFQKELYTFPEDFTPSDCCSVISCNKVTDAVGVGCGQFGMWLNKCLNVKPEVFLSSSCFQGQGGKKVQASADGRYLIVLDYEKKINILCSVTLLLIDSLEEFIVEDFELVETSNSESGEVLQSRIALLTRHENGAARTLQLLSFPFFELQYSVSLSEYSVLAHGFQNQEYIFVVEGVNSSEDSGDGISSLRVRAVCEASPETRLTKLINKQKFEEALDFARKWNLDLQMVYQTQVTFLLDRLSPWVPARFKQQDAEDILIEVTELLSKCTDDHFVAECCLQAAPSSYLGVYSLLNFAQKRLEDCKKCEDQCILISLVNNRLHRLVTLLEIIEESEIDFGIKWWEFSKADLLDMFLNFLRKNSTTKAFLLWNQHQGELAVRLTEDVIKDILHLMPDGLCTKELVMWLEKNFIPVILRQIPSAVDIVASWLTQTALNMEVLKKESWPDSAIELLEVLPNVCDHVGHQSVMGTTTVSVEISLHLWQRIAATSSSSLATLLELLSNLKELKNLKNNYGCHLSLSDFCQEDKVAVVFLILDWVRDINMMERLLQLFLCNYMKKNELDEGNTLLSYIQEVLDTSPHTWWYWEEAPWEEKVLAVINCMQQYSDQRMTAIVATISQAPLPWNLALQTLVDQELSTDHPRKYELETQVRSVGLKLVLKKYEERNFNINNTGAAEVLVQYILSQDRATALEDALEVVKAYDHISDIDCYLFYMRFMLQKERLDNFMDFISLLEPTKLEECCERFISFVEMLLEEPDLWRDELNSRYLRMMTIGSVYILKKLLEHQVKWKEKLQDFESCLHLQVEFGTVCSPYALLDKKWCWNFLVEKVESFLEGKPVMPIMQVVGEKKKQKVNTSYSHFYRLGEILGFKRESVMGLFAQKMAKQGSFGIAVTFCRELVAIYPSVTSAEVLLSICEHFCQNLNDFDQTTEQSAYIFHSLHDLVMHTVTFCTPALLQRCIALSQWTSLLAGLADLATSNLMHSMNNTMRLDHYTIWRFSPLYRDQGLKIQMEYVVPVMTDYINICLNNQNSKLPEKNMCSWNRLVKYLREKGQEQGTLRFIVTACQNDLLVMNKADGDNKVYTSAIQQMKPIIRDIILSLISRICSQKRVDSFLSLGLISSLNKKEAIGVLKDLVRLCGTDFRRLSAVSLVGWEYSKLSSLPEAVLEFSNLNTRSTWGTRLAKLGISFKDAFSTSSQQECYRLLVDLVENHQVDITLIQEYCEAFRLEVDEALLTYLKSLLLGTEIQQWLYNPGWSLKELEKVNTALSKAENVIAAINNPELLLDTLKIICEKIPGSWKPVCLHYEKLPCLETVHVTLPLLFILCNRWLHHFETIISIDTC
ncbi:kinetochore component rough deal isoform X2 [Tachypleus tridentatus]|uniref:kinetochore component rough deal isoform X2 n=1 Tax=Tachypleus tridentatus TaxID=6853 RepID=UPI003FD41513